VRGAFFGQKKDDPVIAEKQHNRNDEMQRNASHTTPFHRSSRTSISENLNPATGRREQVMSTSRMEFFWVAGELVINCRGSRVAVDATSRPARPGRRAD